MPNVALKNVKIFVKKTTKPSKERPRYHQEAKNLLSSLWSSDSSAEMPQKFLLKLSKYEFQKRLKALKTGGRNRDHIDHLSEQSGDECSGNEYKYHGVGKLIQEYSKRRPSRSAFYLIRAVLFDAIADILCGQTVG